MSSGKCKGCGAPILWATTRNGKPIPLDRDPDPKGNIVLAGPLARLFTADDAGATRYMPHHATCPKAKQFKGSRSERSAP
ncbi:MAG TPA: hypothetical protein DCQ64_12545 [Candidatus Rokubacteria bacterium]|nr:hypothetical protein [Candidatus Rokubacteria bacterium]